MQFSSLKIAVMTALLSTPLLSNGVFAAVDSAIMYESALGKSSNPAPSSLGLPQTPSAMPTVAMMGPNGTQLNGAFTQEYRQATLPTTNVAAPAWAHECDVGCSSSVCSQSI